jgi:hypothetical protein
MLHVLPREDRRRQGKLSDIDISLAGKLYPVGGGSLKLAYLLLKIYDFSLTFVRFWYI